MPVVVHVNPPLVARDQQLWPHGILVDLPSEDGLVGHVFLGFHHVLPGLIVVLASPVFPLARHDCQLVLTVFGSLTPTTNHRYPPP